MWPTATHIENRIRFHCGLYGGAVISTVASQEEGSGFEPVFLEIYLPEDFSPNHNCA